MARLLESQLLLEQRPSVVVAMPAGVEADGLLSNLASAGERAALADAAASPSHPGDPAARAQVAMVSLATVLDPRHDTPGPGASELLVGLHRAGDRDGIVRALRAGIRCFVSFDAPAWELARVLAEVRLGRAWVGPQLVPVLVEAAAAALTELGLPAVTRAIERRAFEARFARAEKVRPVFQPVVDLRDRRTVAMLALARFPDPGAEHTAIAEVFGGARRLGLSVELELAAADAALERLPQIAADVGLFVKVSSATIASGRLPALVGDRTFAQVVLEVSESTRSGDEAAFAVEIERLRDLGARFSVDETGAGFGALDRVLALAPSFIRLAGGLTRRIETDRTRRALALDVVAFAAHLGAQVIADQIETDEELRALRSVGVHLGLGYHVGAPAELPAPVEPDRAAAESRPRSQGDGPQESQGSVDSRLQGAAATYEPLRMTPRMLSALDEALRAVTRMLADRLGGASVYVGHVDGESRRVVIAAGQEQPWLRAGASEPVDVSLEAAVLAGDLPQRSDAIRPPEGMGGQQVRSWATVPFAGPPAAPVAFLTAVSAAEVLPPDALDLLRAGAAALAIAVRRRHGHDLDDLARELREISRRDPVTGLLNAERFAEVLDEAGRVGVEPRRGYVVAFRLANFVTLCDRMGRALGELVLKDLAQALARQARGNDTVAIVDVPTFGCLIFGRREEEIAQFCRKVAEEVQALSHRRGATAELRVGTRRLGLDPDASAAWRKAGERLSDPLASGGPARRPSR